MDTSHSGQGWRVVRVTGPRERRGCQQVVFDNGTALLVRSDELTGLNIQPDAVLDGVALKSLQFFNASLRAEQIAYRLLRIRMRSREELAARLRRQGVPQDVISGVVAKLEDAELVNDERFAEAWVRSRIALRPSGRARLRLELAQKGIARDVVDRTLSAALSVGGEEELALRVARDRARRYRTLSRQIATRRLAGLLQRRGFAAGVIASVIRRTVGRSIDGAQE